MNVNFKRISQSKFVHSVLLVASGTAGAQAIAFAFSPIITRLYGPEAFGLLGSFVALLSIVTPISALTYPIAIVLPKSDDDARGLAKLSFLLAFIITTFIYIFIMLTKDWLGELLNLQQISSFLWLIPFAMFFAAIQEIMKQWLIRKKQFKAIASVSVTQSFILNSSKSVIGIYYPHGIVLVLLATLGNGLYALQLWFASIKCSVSEDRLLSSTKAQSNLKLLAYQYRDFPFFRSPQLFVNSLTQSLPVLMLVAFSGPTVAGLYSLARTIMALPSILLGKAVSDVFFPKLAELANNDENLYSIISKATLILAGIGIIPYGIVFFFGNDLFSLVFGAEWASSGTYASWLSVWLYFGFINRPSITALTVLKLQKPFLIYEVISTSLKAIGLVIGFMFFNDELLAVILFSIAGAISNLMLIIITFNKVCKK